MASVVVSGTRGLFLRKDFKNWQLQTASRSLSPSLRRQIRVTAKQASTHSAKLEAALDVVQRACQLCLSVQSRMRQGEEQLDKVDNTPVTIADFGVQALISLELGFLFPDIPLLGEENASQLREQHKKKQQPGDSLVEAIVEILTPFVSCNLNCETVLDAIDRGGQAIDNNQQCYWVLDPIDGTRGFLRGGNALYVVGLALIFDGKPVLGVMGCPNVGYVSDRFRISDRFRVKMASMYYGGKDDDDDEICQRGLVMAASLGEGCWVRPLKEEDSTLVQTKVASFSSFADSWFCISDSEVWQETLLACPLEGKNLKKEEMLVLPLCCGSLCKYFALALGGVSAFLLPSGPSTPLKVWDHASGVACVLEAGGRVSDLEGTSLENLVGNGKESFTVEGGGVLASNKALHDLLLGEFRNRTGIVGQ